MRILTILILTITSIACAQASLQSKNIVAPKNQPLNKTIETKSQTKLFQMPNIETISEADVWRISENKDRHGNYLPPWTEVKVPFFYLEKKPIAGLGLEFKNHQALDFVLQDLRRFAGKGWKLIKAGLQSPVVRNRNMAVTALGAWNRKDWAEDTETILRNALEREPNDETRELIRKVLNN